MDQIYISAPILGAITALIAISTVVIRNAQKKSEREAVYYVILTIVGVVIGAAGAVTPFAYALSPIYGLLHYATVLLSAVILAILGMGDESKSIRWFVSSFFSAVAFPPILLIIAIPLAVLPYFRSEAPSLLPPQASPEISTQAITETFSRIEDGLSEIERDIALESENIDQSIENLTKDIETRNTELRALVEEQSRMAEEVKISRALADLTEEQGKAVVNALNRGKTADKFLDYGVGFLLGLLSSGFILVMQRFTSRRPQLATQQPSP